MFDIEFSKHGKNILILAAHPDDEVLGVGGTLALLARKNHDITPIFFCENSSVRYGGSMQSNLENWAELSAKTLGINPPVFLRMPDQKLDTIPMLEMVKNVEEIIEEYKPETIFVHHSGDINKDHQVLFEATIVATRPFPGQHVKNVLTYETLSSTEWSDANAHPMFKPNVFFDIEETLEIKIKAFSHYESEIHQFPHPRSLEALEIRAKDWGAKVGLTAAEPLQLIRSLVNEPR